MPQLIIASHSPQATESANHSSKDVVEATLQPDIGSSPSRAYHKQGSMQSTDTTVSIDQPQLVIKGQVITTAQDEQVLFYHPAWPQSDFF